MSTYDFEPDPADYGPEPADTANAPPQNIAACEVGRRWQKCWWLTCAKERTCTAPTTLWPSYESALTDEHIIELAQRANLWAMPLAKIPSSEAHNAAILAFAHLLLDEKPTT